jgi:HAMP domain-containing protein
VVQPNPQQQEALEELRKASEDAATQLQTSCPTQIPQTPVERIDAVKARLAAMVEAMKSVRPKLESFYATLSDEQKAKFNIMTPPSAPPPQRQTTQH